MHMRNEQKICLLIFLGKTFFELFFLFNKKMYISPGVFYTFKKVTNFSFVWILFFFCIARQDWF